MAETMRYTGGCHCGKGRDEGDAELKGVGSCNCSICAKKGHLLAFVPESQFHLKSGEDVLRDYQFNKHVIHHLFCSNCGVESFARGVGPGGAKMAAINVRCLDAVDFEALPVQRY